MLQSPVETGPRGVSTAGPGPRAARAHPGRQGRAGGPPGGGPGRPGRVVPVKHRLVGYLLCGGVLVVLAAVALLPSPREGPAGAWLLLLPAGGALLLAGGVWNGRFARR